MEDLSWSSLVLNSLWNFNPFVLCGFAQGSLHFFLGGDTGIVSDPVVTHPGVLRNERPSLVSVLMMLVVYFSALLIVIALVDMYFCVRYVCIYIYIYIYCKEARKPLSLLYYCYCISWSMLLWHFCLFVMRSVVNAMPSRSMFVAAPVLGFCWVCLLLFFLFDRKLFLIGQWCIVSFLVLVFYDCSHYTWVYSG